MCENNLQLRTNVRHPEPGEGPGKQNWEPLAAAKNYNSRNYVKGLVKFFILPPVF